MRVQKTPAPRTPRARPAPATAPTAYRPASAYGAVVGASAGSSIFSAADEARLLRERVQVPVSHAAVSVGRGPLTPRLKRVDPPSSQPSTPRASSPLFAPLSPRVVVGAPLPLGGSVSPRSP